MTDHTAKPTDPAHDHADDAAAVPEVDRLITRLVDGRAADDERTRFEFLAGAQPELWRELAMAHQDEVLLARQFEREGAAVAQRTDVHHRGPGGSKGASWPLAIAGWAALFLVVAAWLGVAIVQEQRANQTGETMVTATLSPEDHFVRYRQAPYVLSEMEPEIVEVEPLSDDRVAIRFIRRIEEVAFLDPTRPLPVEPDGTLTRDPKRLRALEAGPGTGSSSDASAPEGPPDERASRAVPVGQFAPEPPRPSGV